MSKKEYIPRVIDSALEILMKELPALMLVGPRGCGKTTTALRRAASVLRLDKPELAGVFEAAPDDVLSTQEPPVLLDEWQNVPASLGAIKRAVDASNRAGSYLLTGSARSRFMTDAWPATGRIVPLAMHSLTEAELERRTLTPTPITRLLGPDDPKTGTLPDAPDIIDYTKRIARGGFPAALGLSDFARGVWHRGYIEQLIYHDLASAATVLLPSAIEALLKAIALNSAGTPALETLSQAVGIDQRTTKSYQDILETLGITERLPAWGVNRFKRMYKSPKYYVCDCGMAMHLTGSNAQSLLSDSHLLGRMMDTFVLAQLRPSLSISSPPVKAFHLRDSNGAREIDILLESAAGKVVGIEVKASNTVTMRDARHLAWLRDELGAPFVRGVVLHTGATTFPLGERLWAMPLASLWRG